MESSQFQPTTHEKPIINILFDNKHEKIFGKCYKAFVQYLCFFLPGLFSFPQFQIANNLGNATSTAYQKGVQLKKGSKGSNSTLSVWASHSWSGWYHHGPGWRSHHWWSWHHWHMSSHRWPHSWSYKSKENNNIKERTTNLWANMSLSLFSLNFPTQKQISRKFYKLFCEN